jgi:nitrogen regulatory protein PII
MTEMKMVFIVYSQSADYEVIGAIKKAGIKGYTKMEKASGEGVETEPKLHTHTWPGENCVIFLALEEEELQGVVELIRELKNEHPRTGVKAFIMPMEEII